MAHHHAAVPRHHLAEIGQLGRLRIDARHIFQAIGQAERSRLQLGVELRRHPREPGGIGAADRIRHARRAPQRAMAGEQRDIEVDRRPIGGRHPAARIQVLAQPGAAAVLAERDRGDAHREKGLVALVERVAMAVHVDEARREHPPLAGDDPHRPARGRGRRNLDDPVAGDQHIGQARRGARPVDEQHFAEQDLGLGRQRDQAGPARQPAGSHRPANGLSPCQPLGHPAPPLLSCPAGLCAEGERRRIPKND